MKAKRDAEGDLIEKNTPLRTALNNLREVGVKTATIREGNLTLEIGNSILEI